MTSDRAAPCNDACAAFLRELEGNGVDCTWLNARLAAIHDAPTQSATLLSNAYALAARKFGASPLTLSLATRSELGRYGLSQATWTLRQAARSCLLLTFVAVSAEAEYARIVQELFYRGDSEERVVVLRCLALLPTATQHQLVATDAVRSHVQSVFEAIACENQYPMRHFSDLAFNQMVMKAYFTGVAAQRIVGLSERNNPELRRMALDFAAERRAASRPVPSDLELVTDQAPLPTEVP